MYLFQFHMLYSKCLGILDKITKLFMNVGHVLECFPANDILVSDFKLAVYEWLLMILED